jgi:hypothetical protein
VRLVPEKLSMKMLTISCLTLLSAVTPALAGLGDTVESVATDQKKFQARMKVTQASGYTVHELTTDNGTVMNEYVSPAGKVFGVSWSGPIIPDLTQLYSSYFQQYSGNVKKGSRRHVAVRTNDLVVEARGHQRDYSGRAYVISLLPAGVSPEVIQ